MFEYSTTTILHRLGTLYYSRFICKLTYHNIFTGNNSMICFPIIWSICIPSTWFIPQFRPVFQTLCPLSIIVVYPTKCCRVTWNPSYFWNPPRFNNLKIKNQNLTINGYVQGEIMGTYFTILQHYIVLDQRLLNYQNAVFWRSFEVVGRAFSLRDIFWNALDFSINRIIMY